MKLFTKHIENNVSEPATGLNKAHKVVLSIFLVFIIGLIYISNIWTQKREIKEIIIVNNQYIPIKTIQDKVYTYILKHRLNDVNQEYVKTLILENQFISRVDFITTYPEKFIISLKPKKIVAQSKDNNNQILYLTEDGELIPQGNQQITKFLPYIDLQKFNAKPQKEDLADIASFAMQISSLFKNNIKIDEIWKDKNGINFQILEKITVRIGNLDNIEKKFLKFEYFINDYLSKTNNLPEYIDLRWSNQIVTN